jgi:hypothetical protein
MSQYGYPDVIDREVFLYVFLKFKDVFAGFIPFGDYDYTGRLPGCLTTF